ncbi:hypothetical protein EVJ58_g4510 [Rhodofomes roseus]|uniref:Thioester reductase (TE) domain-containing protein n=1 Tax=Rhodofomes roseus TaxID=34475 RepID=A0A4Y9YIL5_9APHY|nr:hypothetical protein EVJ58_g4510 [Rhodofomes roseus]
MVTRTDQARIVEMAGLVSKYTSDFAKCPSYYRQIPSRIPGSVVLVTGTTGSLGCHLLETLAHSPLITRVYALNRPDRKGRPLRDRQVDALRERGIPEGVVNLEKVILVEGELTSPNWGLTEDLYNEIHNSVTHVLHNAWRVDFVSPLAAFEPNISGVRTLIDFCLTSTVSTTPRLVFTSSLIDALKAPHRLQISEDPIPAAWAVGMGYSEAKWVCEEILFAACKATPLDGLVVRVGQITGGKGGAWATTEWFSCMVQSASRDGVGCFPDDKRLMDWFPFELASSALLDFLHTPPAYLSEVAPSRVVHLVHPRPVPWHDIAAEVVRQVGGRLVPFQEWLHAVEAAAVLEKSRPPPTKGAPKPRRMRAISLIPFYHALNMNMRDGARALGLPAWDGPRGVAASPTLADPDVAQLGADDVRRWVGYWRRVGFIRDDKLELH